MSSWGSLPLDVLLQILSYLEQADLVTCIAPVCKWWHECAYHAQLWRFMSCGSLATDPWSIGLPGFANLLVRVSNSGYLEQIDLQGAYGVSNDVVCAIARHVPRLRRLNLSHCTLVTDAGIGALVKQCKSLRVLLVRSLPLTPSCITMILKTQPHLQFLDAAYIAMDNSTFEPLAKGSCPQLQHLCLSGCKLQDVVIDDITQGCPRLAYLSVKGCPALTDGALYDMATRLLHLRVVDLRGNLRFTSVIASMIVERCKDLLYVLYQHQDLMNAGVYPIEYNEGWKFATEAVVSGEVDLESSHTLHNALAPPIPRDAMRWAEERGDFFT
eukprot:m.324483 g.324483  ORF g.324483 m.324483 type:complete len:327 (+) comp16009_c1_seq1:100-1080(+)